MNQPSSSLVPLTLFQTAADTMAEESEPACFASHWVLRGFRRRSSSTVYGSLSHPLWLGPVLRWAAPQPTYSIGDVWTGACLAHRSEILP